MSLPTSQKLFRSVFDMSGVSMAFISPCGEILEANAAACRFLGYPEGGLQGLNVGDITHPEDLEQSLRFYTPEEIESKDNFSYKKRYVRKDGTTVWGFVSAVWLPGPQGLPEFGVALLQDITENQKAQAAIVAERHFLQSVVNSIVDPIKVLDLNNRVLALNHAARSLMNDSSQGPANLLCHQAAKNCRLPCAAANGSCLLKKVQATGKPTWTLQRQRLESGEEHVFEITAAPLLDENKQLTGIVETARNITERLKAEAQIKESEKRLDYLTHYDLLTQLPNRTLLYDRLHQTLARARRCETQVAVLLLDLDRFKKINDTFGHRAADRMLIETAQRLKKHVRQADTLARRGEDEFVITLENFADINHIVLVAQRLQDELAREFDLEGLAMTVTASIGISIFPNDAENADDLLGCADAAMNTAQKEGGNNFHFYTAGMNEQTRDHLALEVQLRRALKENQLILYYQPQIDKTTGKCIGTEALVRWLHPQQGMISPGAFIPLAEETGLIEPIGLWALQTACSWNKKMQDQGLEPIPVSVNISARQLYRQDFTAQVAGVLKETRLDPRFLELEITESMLMREVEGAIEIMQGLNELGVSLAMDDFGTGYSSLSYLRRFPIQKLKIDRSFILELGQDPGADAIARSVIALAQSLNLRVIAEGVETREQAALLAGMGCSEIQGFLFSRPLPPNEIESFLAHNRATPSLA